MRVEAFEVHNVMRVSDLKVDMRGQHLVLIGGENGHGKSSALTALMCALCGKRDADWPEILLKDGENEGRVVVGLHGSEITGVDEGIKVQLDLVRKRDGRVVDEVTIIDSSGEPSATPRALLKEVMGLRAFDPLAFDRAPPKEQAVILKDLLGLDFGELDAKRKEIYDERTGVNRDVKRLQVELESLEKLEIPEGTPEEPVDAGSLLEELKAGQATNAENEKARKKKQSVEAKLASDKETVESLRRRIAELESELTTMQESVAEGTETLSQLATAVEKLQDVDTNEIEDRISRVNETNAMVSLRQDVAAARDKVADSKKKSASLTKSIESIDAQKQKALSVVKWPVEGMSVDSEGVLLNGHPLSQASTAERIKTSAMVQIGLHPGLRLMICQHGNDLDNESLGALEQVLTENDFQCVLEFVTRSDSDEDRCHVVLKNGEDAKSTPSSGELPEE